MSLTVRDRWLAALLPAIITGTIYMFGPLAAARVRLNKVRTELQAERAKPFDLRAMNALSSEYEDNQTALARAKARLAVLNAPPETRLGPATADRSATLRAVSAILEKHNLVIARSEKLESETDNILGKRLLDIWRPYAERTHAIAPQVWRFELRGSYPRVSEACESLSQAPQFVVPLSVTMEQPATDTAKPGAPVTGPAAIGGLKWTLTLWL